jgi:hypothetical protein
MPRKVDRRQALAAFGTVYQDGLQLTLTRRGDGVRGVMTFDVARS